MPHAAPPCLQTKAALEDIEARVKGGTQEPACIMIVGAGYSGEARRCIVGVDVPLHWVVAQ